MIVVEMFGDIGEQLFRYAIAKALSLKYNTDLYIDISWSRTSRKKANLTYNPSISTLNLDFKIAGTAILYDFFSKKNSVYLSRFPETINYKIIDEKAIQSIENRSFHNPALYLTGEFKNEIYFIEFATIIYEKLIVRIQNDFENFKLLKKIEKKLAAGILIKSFRINNKKELEPDKIDWVYLQNAITRIEEEHPNAALFIITDIPKKVRQLLSTKLKLTIIELIENEFEIHNIFILLNCQILVMQNNCSIAWWAAWLNRDSKRINIIPQNFCLDYPFRTHKNLMINQTWLKI